MKQRSRKVDGRSESFPYQVAGLLACPMVWLGILLAAVMAVTLTACIGGGGAPTAPSTVASLSSLQIQSGAQTFALTPSFSSGQLDYTVAVGSNISSVNLVATVADARATIKINNQSAVSGQPFGPINLVLGANPPIAILVDGPGFSQTYTVTITRAATTSLSNLAVSAGTLIQEGTNQPGFTPSILNYTVQAPFTTTTTTVTPTAADNAASVTVNGIAVTSGQPSQPIVLGVGETIITVVVTAPGVASTTYKITVTRQEGSTNANLSSLTVSPGTLTPTFAPTTLTYSASVNNVTTSVAVIATVQSSGSTLQINNQPATSGVPFTVSNLNVGSNPITITVVPQTGTPQVYVVTVNRAAPGNANLSALTITPGTMTPAFAPGTLAYTHTVQNPVTSVTVSPSASGTITINGQAVASGGSLAVALGAGGSTTPISIVVTAVPEGNQQTYTVSVTRAAAGNANLSALTITPGTMTPAFAPGTLAYTHTVQNPVTSVTVSPSASGTITINGQAVASGGSLAVALGAGGSTTPISIVVTAVPEGNQQTYTVSVTRAAAGNANLSALTITPGTMTPAFAPGTLAYTHTVQNPVTSVTVTATVDVGTSTLTINGQTVVSGASLAVPLQAAGTPTPISIVVTAVEGNNQTYTVTVNRPLPGDATLSGLTVTPGTMTPVFASATLSYSVAVANTDNSVTVTASVAVATSTLTINDQAVASGTPVVVTLGAAGTATPISIVVTAIEGNSQTYTVTVNKPL